MAQTYSTYEAKARFSEVIRKVRAGQRVVIAYRGEAIAEIRPIDKGVTSLEKALGRLEDRGILSREPGAGRSFSAVARKPGALKRFLESRE
ncbi:MAG TPA: type II toxin-antitoxin system prevent-host-death family antitoxin [Solirubrobacterales bacterium]|nr:type II toxin-antitoxin system prevent-host-death family antitoxin [Solirubrobacterales bacterium]